MPSAIKTYRTRKKLTQTYVAGRLGISQPTYQRMEASGEVPDRYAAYLADILDVPLRVIQDTGADSSMRPYLNDVGFDYYGDMMIKLADGTSLSAPIDFSAVDHLRASLAPLGGGSKSIVCVGTMDNRFLIIPAENIVEVFFIHDAVDMEQIKSEIHYVGKPYITPREWRYLSRLWGYFECAESQATKQEVIGEFCEDNYLTDSQARDFVDRMFWFLPDTDGAEANDSKELGLDRDTTFDLMDKSCAITWKLPDGTSRTFTEMPREALNSDLNMLGCILDEMSEPLGPHSDFWQLNAGYGDSPILINLLKISYLSIPLEMFVEAVDTANEDANNTVSN